MSLRAAFAATWPAAEVAATGGLATWRGDGGGGRLSATRVAGAWDAADLDAAEAVHRGWGQAPLALVWDDEAGWDATLAARGWMVETPTLVLAAEAAALAGPLPPLTGIVCDWPGLAAQRELWAAGGIGAARQAAMARAPAPKAALLGRAGDRPVGTAFVAAHAGVAFLHALHVRPDQRRQGLARSMLRAAANWALAQGAGTLALAVSAANAPARALYASAVLVEADRYVYRRAP